MAVLCLSFVLVLMHRWLDILLVFVFINCLQLHFWLDVLLLFVFINYIRLCVKSKLFGWAQFFLRYVAWQSCHGLETSWRGNFLLWKFFRFMWLLRNLPRTKGYRWWNNPAPFFGLLALSWQLGRLSWFQVKYLLFWV